MRDELKQYSPYELILAAEEKMRSATGGTPGNWVQDDGGKLIRLTPVELLDRRSVLNAIYGLGAERGDPGWRNFAVEAYRILSAMRTYDESQSPDPQDAG
jgi:hypothetical protein